MELLLLELKNTYNATWSMDNHMILNEVEAKTMLVTGKRIYVKKAR